MNRNAKEGVNMKRILVCLMLALLSLSASSGCYSTGKVAGDTVDAAEEGAQETKEGYEDARDE